MIDLPTIIFALIMFCVIWFFVFRFKLIINKRKAYKNIVEKLEKQDIKTDLLDKIKKSNSPMMGSKVSDGKPLPKTSKDEETKKPKKLKSLDRIKKSNSPMMGSKVSDGKPLPKTSKDEETKKPKKLKSLDRILKRK